MTTMPPDSSVPWAPDGLPIAAAEFGGWNYVVLEEIVDDVAVLRRWPWPVVDPLGRLLWTDGAEHDSDAIAVDLELLKAQLYTANGLQRQPRCGDTFAAPRQARERRDRRPRDLRTVFGDGPMYDVSADAREAAKIAYQASLGAIRPARDVGDTASAAVQTELERRALQPMPALLLNPPPAIGARR